MDPAQLVISDIVSCRENTEIDCSVIGAVRFSIYTEIDIRIIFVKVVRC